MTDHVNEAQSLINWLERATFTDAERTEMLRFAQVHATLALEQQVGRIAEIMAENVR